MKLFLFKEKFGLNLLRATGPFKRLFLKEKEPKNIAVLSGKKSFAISNLRMNQKIKILKIFSLFLSRSKVFQNLKKFKVEFSIEF